MVKIYQVRYCKRDGLLVARGILRGIQISEDTLATRHMKGKTYHHKSINYGRLLKKARECK